MHLLHTSYIVSTLSLQAAPMSQYAAEEQKIPMKLRIEEPMKKP